jgi:haloalkane dehalogenase
MDTQKISSEFPYKSHYLEVEGSKIHYIDEGEGNPVLFIHGNPTSSYLWRNIIPYMKKHGRCFAPDLIGMGKSDKPDIEYRFVNHFKFIEGFIKKMALKNITLVLHDWGSALGFHYAMRYPENIKGIAFMEAIIKTSTWKEFPRDFKVGFKLFRTPIVGWFMIVVMNVFVKQILPKAIVRSLTDKERSQYQEPFRRMKDRKPIWRWPQEIPIDGSPADVTQIVNDYNKKLQETEIPKLLFYAHPGGIINAGMVTWCKDNLKNLDVVDYLQEDNPHLIGSELSHWYKKLK